MLSFMIVIAVDELKPLKESGPHRKEARIISMYGSNLQRKPGVCKGCAKELSRNYQCPRIQILS